MSQGGTLMMPEVIGEFRKLKASSKKNEFIFQYFFARIDFTENNSSL